ncbi:D-lactonohydrolase-like protein-like protein [Xylariales sp. AK1849]|nr:D-lactonohydrolase-like protein-like protein [Xylariales sp. AK1849]
MASVNIASIFAAKAAITAVDLRFKINQTYLDPETISLKQYHPSFRSLHGQVPTFSVILSSATSSRNPFFHNACIYLPDHDELYLTSDLLQSSSSSQLPIVLISKVSFQHIHETEDVTAAEWMKLRPPPNMPMPAGACAYQEGIVFCSQGTLASDTGGLFYMPRGKPPIPLITQFGGRPFNSPQQVIFSKDGSLWFTDSCSGFEAEIRPKPNLPSQIYRYHPDVGVLRAMADGLARPGGICFSPTEDTVYVTDTDAKRVSGEEDAARAATIYAWDVIRRDEQPLLANKRLFAFAMSGVPKAVQCDSVGHVYAACGDGIEIWSPGGVPLGLVEVPGGCSSFCFGRRGDLFIGAEQRLWRVQLDTPRAT